jgi:uncharacterized membrane protein (UPF0127 family)
MGDGALPTKPIKNAKMFWRFSSGRSKAGWAPVALALMMLGCVRRGSEVSSTPKTVGDWFAIAVGGRTVQMQLAVFPAEMERGLMGRRDLAPDQGMIFVYAEPVQMSFWMRNTPLPLDIGFFSSEGELKEVYTMLPYDETAIRSRDLRMQFALEMNQGWFHRNGIRPGATIDLAALRAALLARGAAPKEFGLR